MLNRFVTVAVVLLLGISSAAVVLGAAPAQARGTSTQAPPVPIPPPAPPPAPPTPPSPPSPPTPQVTPILVRVDFLLTRWQGEKKTASEPYFVLSTLPNGPGATLRLGIQVPVPQQVFGPAPNSGAMTSFQYQSVGTNIVVNSLKILEAGRYQISLTFEESYLQNSASAGAPATGGPANPVVIGSFRAVQEVLAREGQSMLISSVTDRVSGEVTKLEVTVTAVK